ncbi:MAG: DUF2608 domain-containing protein [Rickettsiaceae bacterium]|nr:DUF2608 domain-containing protein [Rickettsiaceae bacterium]
MRIREKNQESVFGRVCLNLNALRDEIKSMQKRDLVIFDVDYVLIRPTDEYAISNVPYREQKWQELTRNCNFAQQINYYGAVVANANWLLVDPEILDIMRDLQSRDIHAIALTALYTGAHEKIKTLEDWRINQLLNMGFDFLKSCPLPLKSDLVMPDLENGYGYPMLKSGIIFAAQLPKGLVLGEIFNRVKYKPRKIVFIDDDENNIKSVYEFAKGVGITFSGFTYRAIDVVPTIAVNEEIDELRFQILLKEKKWLSSAELSNRLNETILSKEAVK